jgi:hypothetical protein
MEHDGGPCLAFPAGCSWLVSAAPFQRLPPVPPCCLGLWWWARCLPAHLIAQRCCALAVDKSLAFNTNVQITCF